MVRPIAGIGNSSVSEGQGIIWINGTLDFESVVSMDEYTGLRQSMRFNQSGFNLSFYSDKNANEYTVAQYQMNTNNVTYVWTALLQ